MGPSQRTLSTFRVPLPLGRIILGAVALLFGSASARADLIVQSESFALSGVIGMDVLGFEAFHPALGTLDRVSVSVVGTFTFPIVLLPGQGGLATVDWRAAGRGRLGFAFSPLDASFRFAVVNPSLEPLPAVLVSAFDLSFSLTEVTDLTGFVPLSFGATGAIMTPPIVEAQRDDFALRFPGDSVMEQFLFFPPPGVQPAAGFSGGGNVLLQYEYTPAVAVPEPSTMLLLTAFGIALAVRGARGNRS